jgi:hypothetical protein
MTHDILLVKTLILAGQHPNLAGKKNHEKNRILTALIPILLVRRIFFPLKMVDHDFPS